MILADTEIFLCKCEMFERANKSFKKSKQQAGNRTEQVMYTILGRFFKEGANLMYLASKEFDQRL